MRSPFAQLPHHGSSPACGIQYQSTIQVKSVWFIPTRVGNIQPMYVPAATLKGSSPRVWRIHNYMTMGERIKRFIPTRVENTRPKSLITSPSTVHPHACGEKVYLCNTNYEGMVHPHTYGEFHLPPVPMLLVRGSSPRVWGIPSSRGIETKQRRIIPTRVGNTGTSSMLRLLSPVHPPVCREYRKYLLG